METIKVEATKKQKRIEDLEDFRRKIDIFINQEIERKLNEMR